MQHMSFVRNAFREASGGRRLDSLLVRCVKTRLESGRAVCEGIRALELSQDEPRYVKGERVKHKLFGDGSIAELSGVGREVKAVIDFDDETVGRKTIKLAYTTLERGQE
jgi:hypothetical protein